MYKKTVRIGIIGMGKMGVLHSAILNSIPNCKVVAFCDNSRLVKHVFSQLNYDAIFYKDYVKLIQDDNVDAVLITTPVFLHYPMVKACIVNKKHFFVEKPLTSNFKDARELYKLCTKENVVNMVGYANSYRPTFAKLQEIVDSQRLGKIKSFEAFTRKSSVKERVQNWRFDKNKSGGGVLMGFGSHMISTINSLFGKISKVSAKSKSYFNDDVDDNVCANFIFGNGMKGYFETDWTEGSFRKEDNKIILHFQDSTLIADNYKLIIKDKSEKIIESYQIHDLWAGAHIDLGGVHYANQDYDFIKSIQDSKFKIKNNCEAAFNIQSIIESTYNSCSKDGKEVSVNYDI